MLKLRLSFGIVKILDYICRNKSKKNMDKKDLISLYASASPELRAALEKEFAVS